MPSIEPAKPQDLPAILDLLARCGLPRDGLSEHLATALVAREGGQVVGCAALEVYGESALLRSIAVDEGQRGRGLGQRLVEATLSLARERHITGVYLLTTTAADFFARFFSFQPIAREEVPEPLKASVEFASACPETALAMALRLKET
jgi:amino-acid N-acetyltransferase